MLEPPTGGEIWFDGENIMAKGYPLDRMRRKMGMVFQGFNLFEHKTVLENVIYAPMELLHFSEAQAKEEAMELLKKVGMVQKADVYPSSLSGGQKQRVAIARALLRKPKLLILDDCSSALDLATEKALHDAMHDALKDTTVLSIVQRVSSARMADRIMVLSNGRCAAIGNHDELLASCEIYREILSSQTGEDLPTLKAGGQNG
jgi:ABC-type polar amino acid transport system ATPase subunit